MCLGLGCPLLLRHLLNLFDHRAHQLGERCLRALSEEEGTIKDVLMERGDVVEGEQHDLFRAVWTCCRALRLHADPDVSLDLAR